MVKKISKGAIVGISIGVIVLILILWVVGSYNSLIRLDETVNEKWANVQTAYQRRADLIPNLVETVKGYAAHESEIFKAVADARSRLLAARTPAELSGASQGFESALGRLLAIAENYPDLKANQNFLSLQDQLEGTENRIKVERDIYNAAVKDYNIKVRKFPSNSIAGMFGFGLKEMFQAEQGAEVAPQVKFT